MEKHKPSSRDIEQFSPKNIGLRYGIKRGFFQRVIIDNLPAILICLSMFAACIYAGLIFIDNLPDPLI